MINLDGASAYLSGAFAASSYNLSDQIRLHAIYRADKPAYTEWRDGDATASVSWRTLDADVDRIARGFLSAGVAKGDRIALLYSCEIEAFAVSFAILRAGAVIVPLSPLTTPDAQRRMLEDCDAKILICSRRFEEMARATGFTGRLVVGASMIRGSAEDITEFPSTGPDDLANIIYSSGTTGTPKGIAHSHCARWAGLGQLTPLLKINDNSIAHLAIPPNSNGSTTIWGPAAYVGAHTILQPQFNLDGFFDLVDAYRPTHTVIVPLIAQVALTSPRASTTDLSCFEMMVTVGSPMPASVKEAMIAATGGGLAEVWGLTEGPFTFLSPEDIAANMETVGKPVPGCELRIIDQDGADITGDGGVGEIVGRCANMMSGYWNRPDAEEAALWIARDGRRFFRTGDLGEINAEGRLHLKGRIKDMLISGGINVFPGDIEAEIQKDEHVAEAAVCGAPHSKWGEAPVAFIVPKDRGVFEMEAFVARLNGNLSKPQRLQDVQIVSVLPRNTLGKVVKPELLKDYQPPWS